MADDLLDRILQEVRDRKEAARAAYEESRRLEAALEALGPSTGPQDPDVGAEDSGRAAEASAGPTEGTPEDPQPDADPA